MSTSGEWKACECSLNPCNENHSYVLLVSKMAEKICFPYSTWNLAPRTHSFLHPIWPQHPWHRCTLAELVVGSSWSDTHRGVLKYAKPPAADDRQARHAGWRHSHRQTGCPASWLTDWQTCYKHARNASKTYLCSRSYYVDPPCMIST